MHQFYTKRKQKIPIRNDKQEIKKKTNKQNDKNNNAPSLITFFI